MDGLSQSPSAPRTVSVADDDGGERLDAWLARRWPEPSRSRLKALVEAGHLTLNGQATKAAKPVKVGDVVRLCAAAASGTGGASAG